jgi:hypothetical protein
MEIPAGPGGDEEFATEEHCLGACLGSVNVSPHPATEDPDRFVDGLHSQPLRLDNMCGGRDGL